MSKRKREGGREREEWLERFREEEREGGREGQRVGGFPCHSIRFSPLTPIQEQPHTHPYQLGR